MKYILRNICFLLHSARCSIEIYWFVASYKYFIFHATYLKQSVSLVCAASKRHLKPGTHLSMHQIRTSLHQMVPCEPGYYCECMHMRHMCSWSDMRGTEHNFIQSNIKYACSPLGQQKQPKSCKHWARI